MSSGQDSSAVCRCCPGGGEAPQRMEPTPALGEGSAAVVPPCRRRRQHSDRERARTRALQKTRVAFRHRVHTLYMHMPATAAARAAGS
jgi:hypothetical protein